MSEAISPESGAGVAFEEARVGEMITSAGRRVDAGGLRGEVPVLKKSDIVEILRRMWQAMGVEERLRELEGRIAAKDAEIQRLTEEAERLKEEIEEARAALAQAEARIHTVIQERTAALEQQKAEGAQLQEKIRELEARLAEREQRIAQLEKENAGLRNKCQELEHMAGIAAQLRSGAYEMVDKLQCENRELAEKVAALERTIATSDDKKRLKELEYLVLELKGRIRDLELGLDFFELDVGPEAESVDGYLARARRALESARRVALSGSPRARAALDKLRRELEETQGRAAQNRGRFAALLKTMNEGKGTVAVVVDLVRASERARFAGREAELIESGLELTSPGA